MITFQNNPKLSLDAPFNNYLKKWKVPKSKLTKDTPVTMKLLLQHAGGITGARYKGYPYDQKLPTTVEVLNGECPSNTPGVTIVAAPGTKTIYSPYGYTIIQKFLEEHYKMPFHKLMDSLIIKPFNMGDSTFAEPLPKSYLPKIALGYNENGKLISLKPLSFAASAAGGLWTTPTDLANYVIKLEDSLDKASTSPLKTKTAKEMLTAGVDNNWSLGFEVNRNSYGEHTNKKTDYFFSNGWNSGYLSMLVGNTKLHNGDVVMINTAPLMTFKGRVTQYDFLAKLLVKIADSQKWPKT